MLINLRNALMTGRRKPTAKDYIQDGLVAMWDGIENAGWGVHNPNATTWVDLIGGKQLNFCAFGENYSTVTNASRTGNVFTLSTDFTLHGCIMNCNKLWRNWTMLGIGDTTTAGLQKGICLNGTDQADYFAAVVYRKAYSGTVLSGVSTGTSAGQAYSVDIAFYYASLEFSVFVNGVYIGKGQISSGDWVLGDASVGIGTQFNGYAGMGSFRRYNILYYSRALTASEIARNYAIDKARFNLP
jgi:hypothetical protein